MLAQQRRQKIHALLRSQGGIRVSELSNLLGVSEMTIRRDLDFLASQGHLVRIHGGAVAVDILTEPAFNEKTDLLRPEKERIAQAAAPLAEGKVIGLSAGTTTTAVANWLPRRDLTVVTNAVNIAMALAASDFTVILTGGTMRGKSYALVGPAAQASLDNLWLDTLFLGANGVSIQGGITTPNLAEAEINARLLARARKTIVVADHTKLGRTAFGRIAGLEQVDALITSRDADREFVRQALLLGVTIHLV